MFNQKQPSRLPYDIPQATVIALMHEQFIAASSSDTLQDMGVNPVFDDPFISIV
jgi:hypothetical protein